MGGKEGWMGEKGRGGGGVLFLGGVVLVVTWLMSK